MLGGVHQVYLDSGVKEGVAADSAYRLFGHLLGEIHKRKTKAMYYP